MDEGQISESEQDKAGSRKWIVAAAVVATLLVGGGLAYFYLLPEERPQPVEVTPTPVAAPAPKVNAGDGDAVLRKLASSLSSSPQLETWLTQGDIVRRLVAATNLVADGKSPKAVVGWLTPTGEFAVERDGKQLVVSPKSFARYDVVASVVSGIDVPAAANGYHQVQPFVAAAWGEIGPPNSTFEGTLHQAITHLTATPLPPANAPLVERGALYAYQDPQLEALSGAQKQLLRMGPANARAVQEWLKKLDAALVPAAK